MALSLHQFCFEIGNMLPISRVQSEWMSAPLAQGMFEIFAHRVVFVLYKKFAVLKRETTGNNVRSAGTTRGRSRPLVTARPCAN
jgi:hypothetical protein